MNISFVKLVSVIGMVFGPMAPASAQIFKGRPNCPNNNAAYTWQDYLTGKSPEKEAAFTVRFDHLERNIGTIAAGTCYTVVVKNSGRAWSASGYNAIRRMAVGDTDGKGHIQWRPGDASKFEMNIWGAPFKFDNDGHVFEERLGLVGTMICAIGSNVSYRC